MKPALPILVICYNRSELLAQTLEKILEFNQKQVFIACDGPKNKEDAKKVALTRQVIQEKAKNKNIKVLFQEENLGCGVAVKKALDWFFMQNEAGIILEDDVFPSTEFFTFMEENLRRFENDNNVASVNGFCPWPEFLDLGIPYLKTKYFSMWGWGTWARVWDNFVLDISNEIAIKWSRAIRKACKSDNENNFWQNILTKIQNKEIDTWDYQFFFQAWANDQIHIRPPKNLVQNLGFGDGATHTGVKPWFVEAQKTPLNQNEPNWFLDAAYFYFRHLTYLDNGNFSIEIASKQYLELMEENKQLKLELKQTIKLPKIFKKYLT